MPALVVLPLLALIVSLGIAAGLSLRPWEDDSVSPHLLPAPDIGASIGDAVALPDVLEPAVARAAVVAAPVPAGGDRPGDAAGASAGPVVALGANVAVSETTPSLPADPPPASPPGAQGPQPPPAAPPAPQPAADPPVVAQVPPARVIAGVDGGPGGLRSVVTPGGTAPPVAVIQVRAGEAYALAFSFQIVRMAYGEPGAENRILRLLGEGEEEPALGLQLWDDPSSEPSGALRGIWASGEQMGGDRFLAPVSEGEWHRVVVALDASGAEGFYEIHLDGEPIDARSGLSLPGESGLGRIELGLFRDPASVAGVSEVRFDDVRLAASLDAVLP